MRRVGHFIVVASLALPILAVWLPGVSTSVEARDPSGPQAKSTALPQGKSVREGREIFRHDTFGSEAFWGGALRLHQAIAGSTHGGVGPGLSPKAALGVGLKVDVDKLPDSLVTALKASKVDLDDVGNTIALLQAVMRSSTSYRSMHGQLQSAVLRSSRRSCLRTCYATRPLCSYSCLGWIDR